MQTLKIITSTTRPNSKGIVIANWLMKMAQEHKEFTTELLDLSKINLPLLDEPNHPRLQQYQHEHTKAWSKAIDVADAYIVVLAEYNFSFPAAIKNAVDYLYNEWSYKPMGIVSYGGLSGGLRSQQMFKQVVTTMNMMPIVESVGIPLFTNHINSEGAFVPDEKIQHSTNTLFKELYRWSESMKTLREAKKAEKK